VTPTLRYAAISVALVGLSSGLFALAATAPGARLAVAITAGVAMLLQPTMFTVARSMRGDQFMVGWGLGAMACAITLVGTGFALRAAGLPTDAAMLSLATSLFLTELVEPLLLNS
jgi:hypothetical protein